MSSKRQCHEVPNHRRNREDPLFLFFLRKSNNFGKTRSKSSQRHRIFTHLSPHRAHRWATLFKSRIASPGYAVTHLCAKEVQVHAPHTIRSTYGRRRATSHTKRITYALREAPRDERRSALDKRATPLRSRTFGSHRLTRRLPKLITEIEISNLSEPFQ